MILCEKDILLYAFWECVFKETDDLCTRIEQTAITIETWRQLNRFRNMTSLEQANLLDFAFAGLFFNRTNFSAILKELFVCFQRYTCKIGGFVILFIHEVFYVWH